MRDLVVRAIVVPVAHEISSKDVAHTERRRHEELIEILEAVLLAAVAVATAWSGYQAARWDGRQSRLYGIASKDRVLSSGASTRAGQLRLYDTTTFNFWLQAKSQGNQQAAELFERRFRPAFRPAFAAWKQTDPFHNTSAPPGPSWMPQYRNAAAVHAQTLEQRAAIAFDSGTEARETAERYVRNTVLLATVLFLTALAQRFKVTTVRVSLLAVSGSLLVLCLYFVLSYPRA